MKKKISQNTNKIVVLNMIANMLSFALSMIISFFLTPYITKSIGTEAYGIIGLANSFIGYIQIITVALNSMASRFIIIELHKNNTEQANRYFSSVLIANTVFAILIMIPAGFLIKNIEILKISNYLVFDARVTFLLLFISFAISLIGAFFGIVLYAKNMLWRGSFRVVESNVIRVILIGAFFSLISARVYFVVLASLVSGIYCLCFNIYYTRKYLPELSVRKKYFSFVAIKELIAAGVWNSITKLSQILLDGLDLLLSNIFISGLMTGNVSIAKTIPSIYTSVVALLADSFYPELIEHYSRGRKKELLVCIKRSINVLSAISGICLSMLIVYSKAFYMLWLPDNDPDLLRKLTILSVGTVLVSGCIYSLYSVFGITNKVKQNSIALLITGGLSTATTFLCLKYTNLGIYAIVGVSSIYGIIRNLTFTPIYAAKCLKMHALTFYPTILKNLANIAILVVFDSVISFVIPANSWTMLILNGVIDVISGAIVTFIIMVNKKEKEMIYKKFVRR